MKFINDPNFPWVASEKSKLIPMEFVRGHNWTELSIVADMLYQAFDGCIISYLGDKGPVPVESLGELYSAPVKKGVIVLGTFDSEELEDIIFHFVFLPDAPAICVELISKDDTYPEGAEELALDMMTNIEIQLHELISVSNFMSDTLNIQGRENNEN